MIAIVVDEHSGQTVSVDDIDKHLDTCCYNTEIKDLLIMIAGKARCTLPEKPSFTVKVVSC